MAAVSYRLSQRARADLRNIYRHGFFEFGEAQADRYYASLAERFQKIAAHPFLYPAVDHVCTGYRRSVCGVHTIYYHIENDTVEIIRLLNRQDTDKAF